MKIGINFSSTSGKTLTARMLRLLPIEILTMRPSKLCLQGSQQRDFRSVGSLQYFNSIIQHKVDKKNLATKRYFQEATVTIAFSNQTHLEQLFNFSKIEIQLNQSLSKEEASV